MAEGQEMELERWARARLGSIPGEVNYTCSGCVYGWASRGGGGGAGWESRVLGQLEKMMGATTVTQELQLEGFRHLEVITVAR